MLLDDFYLSKRHRNILFNETTNDYTQIERGDVMKTNLIGLDKEQSLKLAEGSNTHWSITYE